MATLTYCKALPQIPEQANCLGLNEFELFLWDYSKIFRAAEIETIHQLQPDGFDKSKWNTYLQGAYNINKRHANGVIASAKGRLDSAKECRKLHIKTLESKLRSANDWLRKAEKRLKNGRKFYDKKNWEDSKTGCAFPLSCSLKHRDTNWQHVRFQIHHKKRYIAHTARKITALKSASLHVKVPTGNVFVVGSKDEFLGNQVAQWDGEKMRFRVPYCLEERYGKFIETYIGDFDRNHSRLPADGARSWHFYLKNGKWVAAVQFTPTPVKRVSRHSRYGCIGIDLNPGSVGWAYVDRDGNLKAKGNIPLLTGLPKGKQDAQIVDACLQLVTLAKTFSCPIVHETLDFSTKKTQLREKGRGYARMLSGWAYARFFELLGNICDNRGIYHFSVNPAYTSLIGLVNYLRMYGLSSDVAAALVIARRAMRLSERLPRPITALLEMNSGKHVWALWNQLNKLIGNGTVINRRHDYYSLANCCDLVKPSKLLSC
jgi:IS605 OrfB family transposase